MDQRERVYRGISVRAARGYLEGLGGTAVDDSTIAGEDWHVTLSAETVSIGPSLTLTEVTVQFEGQEETLDSLIEAFSQKAMRAGG